MFAAGSWEDMVRKEDTLCEFYTQGGRMLPRSNFKGTKPWPCKIPPTNVELLIDIADIGGK
jgi:hypothetical protein